MSDVDNARGNEIAITEYFDAHRTVVFRHWTQPELVRSWFAPDGFAVSDCAFDAAVGSSWRITFESESGERHTESGVFHEVVEPETLVFTLTQHDGRGRSGEPTVVTVRFHDLGDRTRMEFRQTGYRSTSTRDGNQEGWGECFRKLAHQLEQ